MSFFDINKSILENIYFFSGPLLVIIGLFVLLQIKLGKQQLKESQKQLLVGSMRDAAKISAEQVKLYCEIINPLYNVIFLENFDNNIPKFNGKISDFSAEEMESWDKEYVEALMKTPNSISLPLIKLINQLEAFSVFFIHKIADEDIAFKSIGYAFYDTVTKCYPLITILRNVTPNNYENIISLFKLWKIRIDENDIKIKKEVISKEISQKFNELIILEKKQKFDEVALKPLGTE